ncbi:putative major vault protein [Trypanosoma rangeli]|uniref:Putative major vault protein n=1 Tax=Trypanosoma rangeli TaxID=5698 RepID=A0A422NIL8_TRYRA|nr:putative major vault protein [Trypanosoma rangeli]RNF05301.1 putative major vault protein [Trypanosoma rangeli]|eukprot:RNF05301.1 putative major vault protein [Trypanosoma rangeli]
MTDRVVRLKPYEYVHILDNNTCKVTLLEGPCCFTMQDHLVKLHTTPQRHIVIPLNHYCEVENPVSPSPDGGEPTYRVGHREVRLPQPPFPLYPGEVVSEVKPMRILTAREAIILRALADHTTTDELTGEIVQRMAGQQWLVKGPCLYVPRVEQEVVESVEPVILAANEYMQLSALSDFKDSDGTTRRAGEKWNMVTRELFFLGPYTKLESVEKGIMLSPILALHVRAVRPFYDHRFGVQRLLGDRWLVTHDAVTLFLPTENEQPETIIPLTVVGQQQYCILLSMAHDGVCHDSKQRLLKGVCSFFLKPGERLRDNEVKDAYLLGAHEALLVEAINSFTEDGGARREASSRWLVRGPCSYIPPLEVRVVERRERMLLTGHSGVYVRNVRTGRVRAVHGQALLLAEDEVLWEKPVDALVHRLLTADKLSVYDLDALKLAAEMGPCASHELVYYKVPHNALVQLYDYSTNTSRVEAGPAAVFLAPSEEFTPISLSGGRPKKANCIHSLCLFLGPDFMADTIEVETLDHARLRLELAYNWEFDASDKERIKQVAFAMPDFIGKACSTLANRVRAAIAMESFEQFHRNSSSVIRKAIFCSHSGMTEMREDGLYFPVNGLLITSVDVRTVEPVEPNTLNALKKSVQLAVEIITKSQENEAAHQAMIFEQEAKGSLELQIMKDKALEEAERVTLLQVAAENAAIELSGSSKVQALAESEARLVELQAELDVTPTRCKSQQEMTDAELEVQRQRMEMELSHRRVMNDLAVAKARALADIEATKVEKIFAALGRETVTAIARAGPELKAKLLQALGLKGFLVTDGTSPINLMGMANRVVQNPQGQRV